MWAEQGVSHRVHHGQAEARHGAGRGAAVIEIRIVIPSAPPYTESRKEAAGRGNQPGFSSPHPDTNNMNIANDTKIITFYLN